MERVFFVFFDNYLRFCAQKGVKPTAAAAQIGLDRAAVRRWRDGSIPKGDTLLAIAKYFGVTISELFSENKENAATPEGSGDDPLIAEAIAWVRSMTPEQLAEFRRLWSVWQAMQEKP